MAHTLSIGTLRKHLSPFENVNFVIVVNDFSVFSKGMIEKTDTLMHIQQPPLAIRHIFSKGHPPNNMGQGKDSRSDFCTILWSGTMA